MILGDRPALAIEAHCVLYSQHLCLALPCLRLRERSTPSLAGLKPKTQIASWLGGAIAIFVLDTVYMGVYLRWFTNGTKTKETLTCLPSNLARAKP